MSVRWLGMPLLVLIMSLFIGIACGDASTSDSEQVTLTVYSGRSEELLKPVIDQFNELSGINVQVRWGKTVELAATIMEEGNNTRADLFYAQDPGALGALEDRFATLPADVMDLVMPQFQAPSGTWVGVSGRARTVVYNTERLTEADLPESVWGFTDPKWRSRIGWAPTNASFQVMVTGMRAIWGEEKTRQWLTAIQANDPQVYPKNTPIVQAVGAGEVDVGLVNHYYLYRFLAEEGEGFSARNFHPKNSDPGALVMVSGVGVLSTSENQDAAFKFVKFLLSDVGQQYFASQTFEYPVVEGVKTNHVLVPIKGIEAPEIDLGMLSDLEGTLRLLLDTGVL